MKVWTKDGIKFEFLSYNFPLISSKNTLFNEYVVKMKSLPEIKRDYNISYNNIVFLLDYHGIKKRSMKVSSKQISSKKYKRTCLTKYGVDNVSKLQFIKDKKRHRRINFSKNIENFVSLRDVILSSSINIRENNNIDENIKRDLQDLYKICYNYWLNLTDEQKDFLMDKIYSSIESKITNCLDKLNITYTRRFMVGRRFFDIKINNILIDVNGDIWHANPKLYKENDKITFPFKKVKAKHIWQKDKSKKELAESYGYKVFYIWESDIKNLSDDDTINYLAMNILL
jgi:G:T-mismatch repair DNA endonuclease (very short patch repair protein)